MIYTILIILIILWLLGLIGGIGGNLVWIFLIIALAVFLYDKRGNM